MSGMRPATPELAWAPLAVDQRDVGDDRDKSTVIGTKGHVLGALTIHVPGVTLRRHLYAELHEQIRGKLRRDLDPAGRTLCGVEHVEDIAEWQAPHSGRAELSRAVRAFERRHRRPVVILHGWQHYGPCPDAKVGES